ncbi:MAG: phosphoenolpyruvate--protein phosphotransferase [Oscillospiraceae bacterium]|nr:phosphoenolpyruvate--protein phosphotransferase [Oscillospiraceae bacterium]
MVKYVGTPASGGLTLAKIKIVNRRIAGFKRVVLAPHREKALFNAAVILAKDEIKTLMEHASAQHQDILNFQVVMLDDEGLRNLILSQIEEQVGAARAVELAMEEYCDRMKNVGDEYLAQRASDIRDALTRVIDILDGRNRERFVLTEPCIIVADEILPSDLAVIDRKFAMGFITEGGSYHNHANIIARTTGTPSVCGVDSEILNPLNDGKMVAMDGYTGEVFVAPTEEITAIFHHKMSLEHRQSVKQQQLRDAVVRTAKGEEIAIYANCNDPKDIALAINNGAQGIGLVRSEILFMSTTYNLTLPSQIRFYTECIRAAKGHEITIRTFDIGADKPLENLNLEKEPNPALGMRGVRLMYSQPQLFETQIEALLVSADRCGKINVMIPMVCVENDIADYFEMVERVKERLFKEGTISRDNICWGIMIETPSAALISEELAKYVNFFSIGTNDLTQYVLAADRINTNAARYYNPAHPAVVKLIEMTVASAEKYGLKVSVCGESAADFESAKIYIDKGVRCLSMAQNAMLAIKERLIDEFSAL